MLVISMVETFQRRDIEESKNLHRKEILKDAYLIEKQVVVVTDTMMLIFCVLWGFRRGVTERSPRDQRRLCWRVSQGVFFCWLKVFNNRSHLVDDLAATLAGHLGVHADGD